MLALGTWAIAGFFVITGYGAVIGWIIGLFALWPFGVFLRPHVSKLILVLILVASGVTFLALSMIYLQWLGNSGYS
jgi:hypothetical protein